MDTTTPAAGSAPAPSIAAPATPDNNPSAPVAPVVPAAPSSPAPVAVPTAQDVLSVMSPAERRDVALGKRTVPEILAAKAGKPAPAPAAAPATEPTPSPAPEPTAVNPAAPAAPAASEENDDDLKRMRVTPNDFKEREVIRLMKPTRDPQGNVLERGLTLQEAYLKVYGPAPAAPADPSAPQPGAPAAPAADPALKAYDARITELDATIKKLSEDRAKAREDVDADKADQLSDQIADARAELKILNNERQGYVRNSEQAAVQTFQQQVTASRDRALAPHPELQAEGSLHRLALDAYVQRALNDPARANEWSDPKWPERLIGEFTSKHGLKAGSAANTPAPAAPAAPATPATPTPPAALLRQPPKQVPGAKLVTSADGAQPSARPALTMDDLRAALPHMTAEQRRGLAVRAMSAAQATR